jgi:hypothetical protein
MSSLSSSIASLPSVAAPIAPPLDLSVWQARLARWRRAAELCERAERATGRLREEAAIGARSELALVAESEWLFAYPGEERLSALRLHLEQHLVTTAAVEARAIARNLHLRGDGAARLDGRPGRYRTVLLLDGRARERRAGLEAALDLLRRPDDAASYALVAAPTLEEALCAVRHNPYVGACVLGCDVTRERRPPSPLLPADDRARLQAARAEAALGWWTAWLCARHADVDVVALAQPLGQLHRRLARA